MKKEKAKKEIKGLIEKYKKLTPFQRKNYNEATTRKDFIMPLFEALGWDTYNTFIPGEVIEEEPAIKGTVDYSFRLNNSPQFLVEAKALNINLDDIVWAKQAVGYAWNMGIEWIVLTDFEGLKLFNSSWKVDTPHSSLELTYKEYLTRFDDLWLFSKEGFKNGDLNKQAEKWGITAKRIEVDERLANDLIAWREILFKNFKAWNQNIKELEIDEAVQRILDRFIFIRSCEDRKIESPILWQSFQKWSKNIAKEYNFLKILKPIFRKFDEKYNSNLFSPHLCEELDTEGAPFGEIISELYGDIESGVKYKFDVIKPDVLGKVYEQYLGYLSKKVEKNGLDRRRTRRREQGIYYTPTFIVDYIAQSALKEATINKPLKEIANLKLLDPACGSGSFLVKGFNILNKEIRKKRRSERKTEHILSKYRLLTNNIYGVDLDKQAIEITRLNLLLNAIEPSYKLPLLSGNIKVGNSLISGNEEELKKYFGKEWNKKEAFNWEEEFQNIFKGNNPGFDVIIGNPPWVSLKGKQKSLSLPEKEIEYLLRKYNCDTYRPNLFEMFIWKSLSLLKKGGILSFIVPDRLCANEQFVKIRKFILENFSIKKLWFRVKFPGIIGDTVIFVLKNEKPNNNYIEVAEYPNREFIELSQKVFRDRPDYSLFYINKDIFEIFNKILKSKKTQTLSEMAETSVGFIAKEGKITRNKKDEKQIPVIKGENVVRYNISGNFWFEFVKENLAGGTQDKEKLEAANKIFLRKTGSTLMASFCEKNYFYPEQSLYFIYTLNRREAMYLLAILNSKLMNVFYCNFAVTNRDATPQLKKIDLDKFPIYKIDSLNKKEEKQHEELIQLVDKIIELNKEIKSEPNKSDKWYKIREKIEKTDEIINQKVYKIYNLTQEEIKIIENFGKDKKAGNTKQRN